MSSYLPITALITPIKNQQLDQESLHKLIQFQLDHQLNDILILGSTGESLVLDETTKKTIIDIALSYKEARIWLGLLDVSTRRCLQWIEQYNHSCIYGFIALSPYYLKPTQNDLLEHFSCLLKHMKKPCIIYNNPARCAVSLQVNTLITLSRHPNFFGIKECEINPLRLRELTNQLQKHHYLLCGDDAFLAAALQYGAKGLVSVASNAAPQLIVKMLKSINTSDFKSLHELWLDLVALLDPFGNPRGIKTALASYNRIELEMMAPLQAATLEEAASLKKQLLKNKNLEAFLS
jgi:4-hydroxy-tetrahydrodipicolinate synthase